MSRNLLHKTKIESFKSWMDLAGIEHRPGRGDFQVLQIKTKNGQWQCIFDRIEAPEHYTVAWPLEPIVRRFIKASMEEGNG
ncbi:hypothetical protein [Burkholderia ubonensis]|uniref:hypothetical protein n=1 Tax=Burkholderia ubonensis TaxID=101571 RepID=UPI0007574B92|nr:hypothetical protein [Burkholderia ubonensis]KVC84003.1 hypothetical protein WI75_04855 [Burkholderia ubonensis]